MSDPYSFGSMASIVPPDPDPSTLLPWQRERLRSLLPPPANPMAPPAPVQAAVRAGIESLSRPFEMGRAVYQGVPRQTPGMISDEEQTLQNIQADQARDFGVRTGFGLAFDPALFPSRGAVTMGAGSKIVQPSARARDPALWHGLSEIKLPRPVSEMSSGRLVQEAPAAERLISPEALQGGVLLPGLGDRSAVGGALTHVGKTPLQAPVPLQGGHGYMAENSPAGQWLSASARSRPGWPNSAGMYLST